MRLSFSCCIIIFKQKIHCFNVIGEDINVSVITMLPEVFCFIAIKYIWNLHVFFAIYRDGRLREQDQILAIDGQPLDLSHHEAIRILQSAQGLVQLVVARGQYPNQQGDPPPSPHKQQLSNVQSEGSADMVVSY